MYKKIASNILTVGQLKGILTNFSNSDSISLTGINGMSIAYDEEKGIAILDDEKAIDEIVEQLNKSVDVPELDMNGHPYSVYEEVKEYLESWDCPVTREQVIKIVSEWRDNLKSYIGKEAHQRLMALGVIDETGMSWEEQDNQSAKKIERYELYLSKISNPDVALDIM